MGGAVIASKLQEYWRNRWDTGETQWQRDAMDPMFERNQDVILAGKQDAQVYIPMCGKALELKWFYARGYRVVGVEFVEWVARSFFVDNGLPLVEDLCPVLKCKIFQTPDKRLRIFVCSVFDFDKSCAGEMDIVWDRGAFGSTPMELKHRYMAVMKSLLAPNFSYALETMTFDDDEFKGVPTNVPESVLRKMLGDDVKLRCVDSMPPRETDFTSSFVTDSLWHVTS